MWMRWGLDTQILLCLTNKNMLMVGTVLLRLSKIPPPSKPSRCAMVGGKSQVPARKAISEDAPPAEKKPTIAASGAAIGFVRTAARRWK